MAILIKLSKLQCKSGKRAVLEISPLRGSNPIPGGTTLTRNALVQKNGKKRVISPLQGVSKSQRLHQQKHRETF
jgi:hypothetical protein